MDIVVRCATCYPVRLGDCPDALTFNIGITANTEYAYEICDSQGNTYEGETTTNGSGNVSISTSDVPFDAYPGLFNKWSGSFRLTLYDGDGDAVPFTISGTEYTCIAFSFRETVEIDECNNEVFCGCLSGGYAFPSDLVGQDGDFYIVENSGVILEKVDGAWTVFFVPSSGSVTGASNGLNLEGTNVEMGGALNEDTTIAAAAFDYKLTSVPEANKTAEYEASQDLFGLLAQVGNAINGQGNRYVLTYDGGGDPESWLFQKVSNDTSVGGTYNSTIGYINLTTGIECYFEVTSAGLRMVTSDGTNLTGLTVTQATEMVEAIVNGVTKMTIDSSGVAVNNLTSTGDRLVFANFNGLLGIKTSAQATAMLDNMVGDSGAGGTKGLVPAPAAGDAAAGKFLKADGTWATVSSGTTPKLINIYTNNTVTSANGAGYSFSTPHTNGYVTIPANTLQSGDYLVGVGGVYMSGAGTKAQLLSFSDSNSMPANLTGVENYTNNGQNFTGNAYYGYKVYLFLGAAGAYSCPMSGTATSPPGAAIDANTIQTGGSASVAYDNTVTGFTIDYTQPLYWVSWGIAAVGSVSYTKFLQVYHYRP